MAKHERAKENKRIRQEALREQLSAGGHIQHVVDIAGKLADTETELSSSDVHRLKAAADIKMKIINKYLPDLKAVEIETDDDEHAPVLQYVFQVSEPVAEVKTTNAKSKP